MRPTPFSAFLCVRRFHRIHLSGNFIELGYSLLHGSFLGWGRHYNRPRRRRKSCCQLAQLLCSPPNSRDSLLGCLLGHYTLSKENNMRTKKMPQVYLSPYCKKPFTTSTYGMMDHVEKCKERLEKEPTKNHLPV